MKDIKSAKLLDLSGDVKGTNRFIEHLRFTVENDGGRTIQEYLLPNFVALNCKNREFAASDIKALDINAVFFGKMIILRMSKKAER